MPVALSPIVPPLTSSGSAPVTGTTSDGSRPYALIRDQANFDITADNWDTYRNATILYEVLSRQVITRGSITIAAGLAEEGDRVSISNVRGIDRLDVVFSGDETVDGQDDFIILQGEYFEFVYTGNNVWREIPRPFAEVWARINNTTPIPDDKILPNYNAGGDDVTIDNDTWPNYRNGILRTSASNVSIAGEVANDGDRLTIQKVGTSLLTITIDDSDTIEGDATFETLDEGTYDFIFHQGNWELLRETDAEVIDTIAAQPGQLLTVDDEQTAVTASAIEVKQESDVNVACISTKSSEIWSQGQSETLTAISALDREFAHSAPSTSDLAGFGLKADTNVEGLKIRIRSAVANGQVSRISTLPDNLDDNQENIYGLAFVGDRFIAMGTNRLYDVDENAGAITRVANVNRFGGSSFFVPVDMEYHNDVLYGLRNSNNGTTNLFILNPDTSVASQVANSDQFLNDTFAESIASFNGDFYVAGDTHLYRVDLDTFQRTQIGNYRLASGQDGVSINFFPRAMTGTPDGLLIVTGGSNALSRIDHETGELTFIQNLNVAGGVEAITYKDGAIYVSARDEQNVSGSNTPVITARIYAGHLSDVGFFPNEAIYNDADARGRKAVPVGADITVPADRKTRLVRSHSYNVDVRWSRGTLRHQGQVLALAIQSFTDGPKKLATQNDIEVLDSIEDFALTTSASQVARSKLMAVEPFAFEDEDAQLPVAKLPSSIPTTRLPRYNRFLGTIGASGADFNNFPAANRNELVQAIENPGTVNGVDLESHYFYRAIRDTSNDQGQNWERVEVPESSTDNANALQASDIEDFALTTNTDTPVSNDKIVPNYNETDSDTTLTVDNWLGYRNGVLRTSGSSIILHADIAEDGDRLCVHKVGSNTLTISSNGNVTVNGEAMYEITQPGKYDLIVRGTDWEVLVPQPVSVNIPRSTQLLASMAAAGQSSVTFDLPDGFRSFTIIGEGLNGQQGQSIDLQFGNNGTFVTGSAYQFYRESVFNTSTTPSNNTSFGAIRIVNFEGGALETEIRILGTKTTNSRSAAIVTSIAHLTPSNLMIPTLCRGVISNNTAYSQVRLSMSSGNYSAGNFYLYGDPA